MKSGSEREMNNREGKRETKIAGAYIYKMKMIQKQKMRRKVETSICILINLLSRREREMLRDCFRTIEREKEKGRERRGEDKRRGR